MSDGIKLLILNLRIITIQPLGIHVKVIFFQTSRVILIFGYFKISIVKLNTRLSYIIFIY